ncbi:hypothetical protein ACFLSJ_02815 [Verrucomicrobiota bacterium]
MGKSTPITLLCLLGAGALLFSLNAFFPVPVETWLAAAGMLVFAAGLVFGAVGFFRSVAALVSSKHREAGGIVVPFSRS